MISHGPKYSCLAVPYCPIWTHCTILEWNARLDEHDSRRHQPGSGEPPQSFQKDIFYLESYCRKLQSQTNGIIYTIDITRSSHLLVMCIRYRIPISYTISCSILIKIIDIDFVDSISRGLNRYRIINIDNIRSHDRSNNFDIKVTTWALIVVSTRLLQGPRAYYISKNKHTIWNIIRYRTMNIRLFRYQRGIIDIEFVESISRGLNRYRNDRIINIVLSYQ